MNKYDELSLKIKKLLPKTIFARFMLIILVPIILMQLAYVAVFINNYWEKINKKSINVLIKEFSILNKEFDTKRNKNIDIDEILQEINNITTLKTKYIKNIKLDEAYALKKTKEKQFLVFDPIKDVKIQLMESDIKTKKYFRQHRKYFELCITKNYARNEYFCIETPIHRIIPRSLSSFIAWSFCPAILITVIVFLFLKNQIRSIKTLTKNMNEFSILEKENENFKPTGASEIREMGIAFIKMQKQIKKYINEKILIFAEVSHDLRTPLTRMKLEAEFIDDEETKNSLKKDINEMEKMINEYLCFAKGQKEEQFEDVNIKEYFSEIVNEYVKGNYNNITIEFLSKKEMINIKKLLFKRAINNIINNSLKYAKNIEIKIFDDENDKLHIVVSDDGCGVSKNTIDKLGQSFYKIETNINTKNSFGLGLAITKKIIYAHNGKLFFRNKEDGFGFVIEIIL